MYLDFIKYFINKHPATLESIPIYHKKTIENIKVFSIIRYRYISTILVVIRCFAGAFA